jgi:opacity protein-like surface antigen
MFKYRGSTRFNPRLTAAALCGAGALALGAGPAHAGIPGADFYIGAGIGQSNADLSASDLSVSSFDKKDTGWKVFVGGRFLSFVGAELDYIDFGKPSGSGIDIKYKGIAGYGLFYFPIPLPILDVYAKAGVARVDVNPSFEPSTAGTKFAYGAGLQLKFGSFAIRGEYERFKADASKPSMLSVGLSKSFL